MNSIIERLKFVISANPDKYKRPDPPSNNPQGNGTVASLWDGTEARRIFRHLEGPYDQVLSLHCDGVSITTFNGKSFYPLLCVLRNMRADQATKSENLIVCMLWEGTATTAGAQTIITPLVDELRVANNSIHNIRFLHVS